MLKRKICGNCHHIDPDKKRKRYRYFGKRKNIVFRCKRCSKWVEWLDHCHMWEKWTRWDELKWQLKH